jgi:hypothetical protein
MIRSCTPARYVTRHSVVFPGRRCVGEDPKSRLKNFTFKPKDGDLRKPLCVNSLGEVALSSRLPKQVASEGRMTWS